MIFLTTTNYAQSLTGKIIDKKNAPLEFVTVSIKKENKILATTISDNKGQYIFKSYLNNFPYTITYSLIGYINLDTIINTATTIDVVLQTNANQLKTVTVISKKPTIIRKADRYIVNIENSFLANGYTALDLLQKSPGLWIASDGQIKLRGSKTVSVMINNVMQKMSADELQDYLKTLKSENVSKIEVITNPGAEYDAEGSGGVVNIVLKKAKTEGLQGNISTTYKQQKQYPYISPALSLSYKTQKIIAFASASYTYDKSKFYSTNEIIYPNNSFYNTYTDIALNKNRQQYVTGFLYDIDKTQSISLQNIYSISNSANNLISTTADNFNTNLTNGLSNANRNRNSKRNSTTFNYAKKIDTLGSTLNIIADYTFNKSIENNNFDSKYSNATQDSIYKTNAPFSTNLFSIQTDYKTIINKKTEWKLGAKFSTIKRDNNLRSENFINSIWKIDSNTTNHFKYDENIFALYSSVNKSIKKYDISLGLRVEFTNSKVNSLITTEKIKHNYFNLFPSFSIQDNFNEPKGHSWYFSFTSRLSRPDFNELNPYKLKTDNYTYQIGNPNLSPQYGYNFDAGINLFNDYNFGIYYTLTTNSFANLATIKPNNILEYQTQNFKNSQEFGLYTTLPFKIAKWWTTSTDLSGYFLQYQLQNYTNNQYTFSLHTTQNITIKKIMNIDVITDYRSPYVYSNAEVPHQFYTDLGFSKSILNNKGKLRFLITDIFNTRRDKVITQYNNTSINFYQKPITQTFAVTFSYNFIKGIKFQSKKILQNNNEEKSRLDR